MADNFVRGSDGRAERWIDRAGVLTPVVAIDTNPGGAESLATGLVLAAGAAVVGKVGIDQTTPGTTNAVQIVPGTSGGWTPARVKSAATTNATNVKASSGMVGGYALFNGAASARFVKFYDKASSPTVGSDTPLFTVILPAGGGANVGWPAGAVFATGVSYAITGLVADSDTTVVAADDVHGVILWK